MTTTSTDLARETAIARLSGHAAIVFERAHEDYNELVIAIYEQAYRDALTCAWPVLEAAHALASRFGNSSGPFGDAIWGGTVDNLKSALTAFDI